MKSSCLSYFFLHVFLLASLLLCLQQNFISAASESESCGVEGSIRTQSRHNVTSYHLLQVCLFGQWNYVCRFGFNNIALNVALHQLGYTGGALYQGSNYIRQPTLIPYFTCIGVERRLIDCPIISEPNNYMCFLAEISVNNDTPRLCENGELIQTNVILQICVNGNWRTLCPSLWGPAQATVACRQLNPGRTVIGVAKSLKNVGMDISALHFKNPLYCKGNEKHITDCVVQYLPANDNLCNDTMGVVTSLTCQTGPEQLTLRAVSSSSVEVNWAQPVSAPIVPPQYRINYIITCTGSNDIPTTTSQYESTPAVNESTHIHMIISGLMSNISYTCCVSAHSELGSSESVCDTVITTDKDRYISSNNLMMSSAVVQSYTIDVRATPRKTQDLQISTAASWVGGVIIGAVLSTVMLITVLVAVCLWRRKRTHSQHNTSVVSEKERTASFSHTNDICNAAYSCTSPQPYEDCQPNRSTEPEYLYATPHTTSTLQQQSNSNVMGLPVVDNTVLYSMCEEGVQEKREYVYSEINRK